MLPELGLGNCLVSVIVSRQMNPTSGCPRPPEPPVQDAGPVAFADTFFLRLALSVRSAAEQQLGPHSNTYGTPPLCWILY